MVYRLSNNEVAKLVTFAEKVMPLISSTGHTSLREPAFRFFNRGVDDMARSDYPLAVVDYVSCLEALLSPGSAELAHRLSQIMAIVSEREVDKRKTRYEEFRRLYTLRSEVIHGGEQGEMVNDASFADDLARKTLRICLGYYFREWANRTF
jgi:hypothetical protein